MTLPVDMSALPPHVMTTVCDRVQNLGGFGPPFFWVIHAARMIEVYVSLNPAAADDVLVKLTRER